jgi:hypothetical protein
MRFQSGEQKSPQNLRTFVICSPYQRSSGGESRSQPGGTVARSRAHGSPAHSSAIVHLAQHRASGRRIGTRVLQPRAHTNAISAEGEGRRHD